ncbi:uncharacterized protein E0L32_006812 [Thyridium curvatum]|uniref:Uncharacterized protein n=1 Tax=Thyridium curvatum TaxID=1093900 RepID=A0A507B6X8_9PEZI|nr:uncharacterized protein E0L32_006812 [Thyridium curvatum]TPX12400.1 hypothetical protein E0L32_006812 [Thyridium curvatum]
MTQPLYVLVYPSRLFAAHWSLWAPRIEASGQESVVGDRIHVTGDRLNGFQYEYIQNYNVDKDERNPKAFPIGRIKTSHLEHGEQSTASSDGETHELKAINAFDRACQEVEAPGPSLNKVSIGDNAEIPGPPRRRSEVKDCQWWIKQAVANLVEANILLPLSPEEGKDDPVKRVSELPKH